jgi:hypothetical protein
MSLKCLAKVPEIAALEIKAFLSSEGIPAEIFDRPFRTSGMHLHAVSELEATRVMVHENDLKKAQKLLQERAVQIDASQLVIPNEYEDIETLDSLTAEEDAELALLRTHKKLVSSAFRLALFGLLTSSIIIGGAFNVRSHLILKELRALGLAPQHRKKVLFVKFCNLLSILFSLWALYTFSLHLYKMWIST